MDETLAADASIREAIRFDLEAVCRRDPAACGYSVPFLYFKGFQALQSYRVAHSVWQDRRTALALHLQSRISAAFDVDIHPAARIGKGILIDHGTSVVIGETAVIEDNVSMLHEVTLGGTGKATGDRHPKIRHGVLIGAGPRSWATLKWAKVRRSVPAAWSCGTCRPTRRSPESPPWKSVTRTSTSPPWTWISCFPTITSTAAVFEARR